jgi:hypothetical protein
MARGATPAQARCRIAHERQQSRLEQEQALAISVARDANSSTSRACETMHSHRIPCSVAETRIWKERMLCKWDSGPEAELGVELYAVMDG